MLKKMMPLLIAVGYLVSTHANAAVSNREDATLSDGQIAQIGMTACKAQVAAAELAKKTSTNAAVTKFAEMIAEDHTNMEGTLNLLLTNNKIVLQDSDENKVIAAKIADGMNKLSALKGAEFDKAYANMLVESHEQALELARTSFLPAVQNADLKALIEKSIPALQSHLDQAIALRISLSGT